MPVDPKSSSSLHAVGAPNSRRLVIAGAIVLTGVDDGIAEALAVDGNKIAAVGSVADMRQTHAPAAGWTWIDGSGYVATPGLINAHTHVPMGFFRGIGHAQSSMIETFLFPAEKSLTPELIAPLSYSSIYDGLRSGVTCFFDHYYFSAGVADALETFGLRGFVGETVADLGGAFPTRGTWTRARQLIERWPYSERIRPVVAPHAADTVSVALMTELAEYARANSLAVHMHLAQSDGERARVLKRDGHSPVAAAAKAGLLSDRTLAVHLIAVDDTDAKILADAGVTCGWCPTSQIIFERLAPIAMLAQAGVRFALGTDCAASHDKSDMLYELHVAATLLRDRGLSWGAGQVLALATRNPAAVVAASPASSPTFSGTLSANACADIVFLKRDVAVEPMTACYENFLHSFSSRHVAHVMVDGSWVLWKGESTRVSLSDAEMAYRNAVTQITRRIS